MINGTPGISSIDVKHKGMDLTKIDGQGEFNPGLRAPATKDRRIKNGHSFKNAILA